MFQIINVTFSYDENQGFGEAHISAQCKPFLKEKRSSKNFLASYDDARWHCQAVSAGTVKHSAAFFQKKETVPVHRRKKSRNSIAKSDSLEEKKIQDHEMRFCRDL